MTDPAPARRSRNRWLIPIVLASALGAVAIAALLTNIFARQQEARNPFYRVVTLTDTTSDPAEWGKNFPQQYDSYRRTVDMVYTRYGGSEATPRTPTATDPRAVVAQSRLDEDPRLREMWAGPVDKLLNVSPQTLGALNETLRSVLGVDLNGLLNRGGVGSQLTAAASGVRNGAAAVEPAVRRAVDAVTDVLPPDESGEEPRSPDGNT